MKKFLIIMAMVLIASAVNAASVSWSGVSVPIAPSKNTPTSYTIYLIDASTITKSQLSGEIAAGNFSNLTSWAVATTAGKVQSQSDAGVATSARWSETNLSVSDKYNTQNENHTFYTVIIDNSLANAGSYLITNETTTSNPATGNMAVNFGTIEGSWAPIKPVPEPTSGLLIMLGVAALALKRKKA